MFVKFLETESAPEAKPLPLPVDRMVEEEKRRAEQHQRAEFNPFIAPSASSSFGQRPGINIPSSHLSTGASSVSGAQSHPLLIGEKSEIRA